MINETFSKRDIYDTKIKDHVKRILLMCDEYNIPMFMTFAVENNPQNTTYVSEMRSAAACDLVLTNDRLVKHALVMNDFEVIPKLSAPAYETELEDINMPLSPDTKD